MALLVEPDIERVLLYRLGSLGDTLLALPALHVVRNRFPRAEITLLTHIPQSPKAPSLMSLLEHTNLYQRVVNYPLRLRSLPGIRELQARVAAEKFQVLAHLAEARGRIKSLRDFCFFRWCGIPRIVGLPWRRFDLVCREQAHAFEWEARRLVRRVAGPVEINLEEDRWWNLFLRPSELAEAERLLAVIPKPFIAAGLGAKIDAKDWTEPNWAECLRQIALRCPGTGLVLLGSSDEYARSDRCSQSWPSPRLNLCGHTGPRVSAAVLKHASLFIGHDSGPMHLAATVGTPCLVTFSARSVPGQWFPRGTRNTILYHKTECFGCGLEICVKQQKRCLMSISVQEVISALEHYLPLRAKRNGAPEVSSAALCRSLCVASR
jgi:ADP-heptose:LPS heptosyltransferase